ncbi:hypothetical protein D3C77_512470 [compost metagenome]
MLGEFGQQVAVQVEHMQRHQVVEPRWPVLQPRVPQVQAMQRPAEFDRALQCRAEAVAGQVQHRQRTHARQVIDDRLIDYEALLAQVQFADSC